MKNILFHHSVSRHAFLKWLICGLFAFFAGLCSVHATAISSSGSEIDTTTSFRKKVTSTNWQTGQNTPNKKMGKRTACTDWQKCRPFWQGATSASTIKTSGKAVTGHLPTNIHTANGINKNMLKTAEVTSGLAYNPLPEQMSEPAEPNTHNEGYSIGPARFTVNYEKTNNRDYKQAASLLAGDTVCDINCNDIVETNTDRDNFRLGMEYSAGNGRINASLDIVRVKITGKNNGDNHDATDLKTLSVGYSYDMSDKTSLYGTIARTEYDKQAITGNNNSTGEDSVTGLRVGITHRF